ncbi:MAG: substrate-binding domain-containing protein [Pseudomonadota bacterium]
MCDQSIQAVVPVALKEVFEAIAPQFTAATGYRIDRALMLNPEVPDHVAGGGAWSIALSNPPYIEKILRAGAGDGGMHRLGYAPLAFAMRGEACAPPLEHPNDIASFLVAAESIAITEKGTSGAQFAQLAKHLGLLQDLQPKLQLLPGGGPMAALQEGNAEVAALPLTNIASVAGVFAKAVCPYSMDVHIDLAFCVSALANTATASFARWLLDPMQKETLQALGLRPCKGEAHPVLA